MAFLRTVITPAGVPAVHEVGLAGHHLGRADAHGVGQWEDLVSELPELIKAGGDVATQVYRAVNYEPATYPTGYYGSQYGYPTASGPGLLSGISPTMLLLGGGVVLALFMMRK